MKSLTREDLPDMSAAYNEICRLQEKKKLDPVGKEDGDVDNDGDKDSSDEYLMKRRKAIGKAMKKEEIVEVKKDDLDNWWNQSLYTNLVKKYTGGKK